MDNVNPRTLEFWVKREGMGIRQMAAKSGTGGYFNAEIQSAGGGNGPNTVRLWEKWSNSAGWRGTTQVTDANKYYYVAITYDSGSTANTPAIYIDGVAETVTTIAAPSGSHASDAANALRIGAASWGEYFSGVMDEVRLSKTMRSAGWIQTTYNTIHAPETFLSVGAEEAAGGGCTYAISPTSASPSAAGGSGSVSVTAGAGCAWTAVSNAGWITVTSGASGVGNGTVG